MNKIFKIAIIVMSLGALTWASGLFVNVSAYEGSDIDRIYITSDTALRNLQKEYVPATLEVVDKDGTVVKTDASSNVKLRGNSTSKAEKKPFKIKFNKKYSLFGMDEGKGWNVLANAFDKTLIRNKLGFDLATAMGVPYVSQSHFCDVFYNGVLQGNYLVTEPVEAGANKVDIGEDEETSDFLIEIERERYESDVTYIKSKAGVRFGFNVPEVPTKDQVNNASAVINRAEDAMKTYRMSEYGKYIDVDSFVNYYIVSEIFKAVDFNYSSTRFFCKNGKMYAGPIWDIDLSSGNASKTFYKAYYDGNDSYKNLHCTEMRWYGFLMQSDEFVAKVKARLAAMKNRIENMYANNSLGKSQISQLTTEYGASFARNYASADQGGAGWSLTKRYSTCDNPQGLELDPQPTTYNASVSLLQNWLKNRVNYLEAEWKALKNNYVDMLTASKKGATGIYLDWYNNGLVDGVEIQVSIADGKYKVLKTFTGDVNTYTAKKIKPGVKYKFAIRTFVKNGNTKTYSPFTYVSKKLTLKKPSVKVKRKGKKAKVTWKKVAGAEGYIVYGGKKKLKKLKVLKGNKKTKYSKKVGKKYYFKVKAFVKVGKKKYYSKGSVKK
ncbi:MAG: CotH kinase family protein [Eubacterium sp.]|nr:CotH kinase family protein [Eubacterium sp.]